MAKRRSVAELQDLAFMQGYAIAVNQVVDLFDEPTMAADMIKQAGFSREDFDEIDPKDRRKIRKLLSEERKS